MEAIFFLIVLQTFGEFIKRRCCGRWRHSRRRIAIEEAELLARGGLFLV